MKDFKNENEYGNMKLDDEAYDGILLKPGDEEYRYYSTDIGNITLTSYYQSETSSTAIITMSASCPNAESIYIRLLKTNGEIIYSAGASATTISKQKSFMSAGTYIVEAEAYGDNGTKKIKRTEIEVNTATGPVYNCENCCDKGWLSPTYKCNQCDAWENNFAPTLINYTYESTTSSTFNVTMNAVCHNAYNMYIRLKNANGNEVNNSSQGASATNVSKTVTFLGFGTYTIEVEVIASDGRRKTDELTFELTENSGDSSGSYETVAGSSDCSYCNGKGFIGNVVCNKCRHSEEHLSDITITYSNIVESASYIDEDAETTYTLSSSVNCPNACNIYATLVDNTTNERKGSFGASATTVTANFTNLKQGTYRMEARAISSSGMEKYKNEIIDVPYIGAAPAEQDEPTLWYNVVGHNHTAGTYSICFSSYYSGATQMQVDIKNIGEELVYTTGKVAGSVAGDRVDLPEGEYQAIATAYTQDNAHPSGPKFINIPVYDMDIVIDDPVITAKEDGTYDVKIEANTEITSNMYLKVIDDANEVVKYSYETSSNRFDVTCNLPSADYTIVVNSVYYEGTICRAGKKEKPITVGHPVGGGPGGTATIPSIDVDKTVHYDYTNNKYIVVINATCSGTDTFEITIDPNAEVEVLSKGSFKYTLDKGKYRAIITAYIGDDCIKENVEINADTDNLEINETIAVGEVNENRRYDVTATWECSDAEEMHLYMYDEDNTKIFEDVGTSSIPFENELNPGKYKVVIEALKHQENYGFAHFEKHIVLVEAGTESWNEYDYEFSMEVSPDHEYTVYLPKSLETGKVAVISAKFDSEFTENAIKIIDSDGKETPDINAISYFETFKLSTLDGTNILSPWGGWYAYSLMSYFKIAKYASYALKVKTKNYVASKVKFTFYVYVVDSVNGFTKCAAISGTDIVAENTNNNFVISASPERLANTGVGELKDVSQYQKGDLGFYLMKAKINGHANIYWEHFINQIEMVDEEKVHNMKYGVLIHNQEDETIFVEIHRRSYWATSEQKPEGTAMIRVWRDYFGNVIKKDDTPISNSNNVVEIPKGETKWISLYKIPNENDDYVIFNGVVNGAITTGKAYSEGGILYEGDNVYCYTYFMSENGSSIVEKNFINKTEQHRAYYEIAEATGFTPLINKFYNHDSGSGEGAILSHTFNDEINVEEGRYAFLLTGYDAPYFNTGERMELHHAGKSYEASSFDVVAEYDVYCSRNYGVIYKFIFATGVVNGDRTGNVKITFKYNPKTNPIAAVEGNGGAVFFVATSSSAGFVWTEEILTDELTPDYTIKYGQAFELYVVVSGMSSMPLEVCIE